MDKPQVGTRPFKTCTICETVWQTRDDFLDDPDIFIVGYQPQFDELTEGLFLFNHSCRGTLSIKAGEFTDLYEGPIFKERLTGSGECPGHCLRECELSPCPAKCECVFVREIVQVIKDWHRNGRSTIITKDTKNVDKNSVKNCSEGYDVTLRCIKRRLSPKFFPVIRSWFRAAQALAPRVVFFVD